MGGHAYYDKDIEMKCTSKEYFSVAQRYPISWAKSGLSKVLLLLMMVSSSPNSVPAASVQETVPTGQKIVNNDMLRHKHPSRK